MKNRKSTKRALLMSALSILMCVSMLIGTTYAWFTDSVTSANNIIKSGNLDVEMYWADGTKAVPGAESEDWEDASEGPIFNYDKWEPGYVAVRHIKIANEGTLALKYQLSIAANGEVSKLSDAIDVYYADPAVQVTNRTVLTEDMKLGTLTEVLADLNTTASGALEAGKDHTVTLALKMQESAGNEYQNLAIGSDFSVMLVATQETYEEDSFDDQYDKDAAKDGIRVEDNGLVILYTDDGVYLEAVNPAFVGDTVEVPVGVTSIGYGSEAQKFGKQVFASNLNVKKVIIPATVKTIAYQAFKDSAVESVTLPEGLTEIGEFAFNGAKKLTSFNIPSTVKVIGKHAFRQTAATEVIVHAGVEKIVASFRDMPNLATVTIEGNTAIADMSFRDCPSLRNVYLKGEDITLGGGTTFCNASTNNPGVNNITFYVENEIVASRVNTAMGRGTNFYIYIDGQEATVVDVANQAQLQAALDTAVDGTVISFTADITGDVTTVQKQNVKITINGNGKTMKGSITIDGKSATILSAGLGIKNINFDAVGITKDACIRLGDGTSATRYVTNLTVENCTFTGNYPSAEKVGIKTYTGGGQNLTVKNCTATSMHSLSQIHNIINVTFEDCTVIGSKNGISVGASRNAKISNCAMSVSGYGIRGDANEVDSALTIADCKIEGAFIPVVIRKAGTAGKAFDLTVNGTNTITGTKNTDGLWCAIGVEEYGDVTKENLTAASAKVTVTLNDTGLSASGVYGAN